VRVARELVRQITARTTRIGELESELAALVQGYAPQLLAERGCGPLTAAKLIGEIAGADRFATDAKLARTGGAAPIPASSGNTNRHRLDRGGNRQLNCALHRLAVNKAHYCPHTAAYLERKQAEGKSRKEALRALKRYLARRVWRLLLSPATSKPAPVAHDTPERPTTPETMPGNAPYLMPCVSQSQVHLDFRKQREALDIGATSVAQRSSDSPRRVSLLETAPSHGKRNSKKREIQPGGVAGDLESRWSCKS
jgi:Transposase IS116/IS110/IS902 family